MRKIGFMKLNNDENVDAEQPHYTGTVKSKTGDTRIVAYCGRNERMKDYLNLYIKGQRYKAMAISYNGDYHANLDTDGKLHELIFKRVWNKSRNIIEGLAIYLA